MSTEKKPATKTVDPKTQDLKALQSLRSTVENRYVAGRLHLNDYQAIMQCIQARIDNLMA